MIGKIVWTKSGDEISFVPSHPDFYAYYVENLNNDRRNIFHLEKTKFDFDLLDGLAKCLKSTKQLSNKIPFLIDNWDGDLLDQSYLNTLHRQWVQTGLKYPSLPPLLKKMNNVDKDYRNINMFLHQVESSFSSRFVNYLDDPYQLDNVFGTDILSFDIANICLAFDNLGRSHWEKFINFDNHVQDTDTNNFSKISGKVTVMLRRPTSHQAPKEYVEWCVKHGVPIVGKTLNVGNIDNLDSKLTDIRKMLVRNVHEQNDQFFFEICS